MVSKYYKMVRRRMRMKLEFMLEDLSGQDASDEVLSDFLKRNPDSFRDEVQLTLRLVYLNPDQLRIPAQTGHRFRSKVDRDSGGNWTGIPAQTGH